ncbi:hypothetical protein ACQ4WX_04585 [Streptomyces lasalocidi]
MCSWSDSAGRTGGREVRGGDARLSDAFFRSGVVSSDVPEHAVGSGYRGTLVRLPHACIASVLAEQIVV